MEIVAAGPPAISEATVAVAAWVMVPAVPKVRMPPVRVYPALSNCSPPTVTGAPMVTVPAVPPKMGVSLLPLVHATWGTEPASQFVSVVFQVPAPPPDAPLPLEPMLAVPPSQWRDLDAVAKASNESPPGPLPLVADTT